MLLSRAVAIVSCLCVVALGSAAKAADAGGGKSPVVPAIAPASHEGEAAIKRFRVPKDLKVELFAAEPMLANPVAFCIDEKGRFYVAETFRLEAGATDIREHMNWLDEELAVRTVEERVAYMTTHEGRRIADYQRYSDRVSLIIDSDGDGRADKATVFAEGFTTIADGIGAGVLARTGDVYYACIPNLWLLRDTRGTGTADFRKVLSTGYGVRVGFIGHDLHGLRFGPDGKLYFTLGDRGAHIPQPNGRTIELHETGAVFRCDPDGSNLEVFAFGLRNPQELAFDQFGNLFTGDNNSDGGDPARWVYLVEGGDSGWRIGWQFINQPNARGPWLAERLCYPQFEAQAAYIIPPLANIGNGPSGLAYYPGTGLTERYRDRFFLCDFRGGTGSGVHAIAVKPRGAGFEVTERSDFIWDVLVTDGDFGYDGCFYISDWVNGWSQTGKGRIYRVFAPDRQNDSTVASVKKLMDEGFDQRSNSELAGLLSHPDQRVRQEAQFALASKGSSTLDSFIAVASDTNAGIARLHAVWGLGQLAGQTTAAIEPLLQRLRDRDPEVRSQAAKVLGDVRSFAAYGTLVALLADHESRPRFFAAIALGKLKRRQAVPALLTMLRENENKDAFLRHAGVMGLVGCATPETLRNLANDPSFAIRLAAVVALRRLESSEVAVFLRDSDPAIVLEAARAINDLPIPNALPQLVALAKDASRLAVTFDALTAKVSKPDARLDFFDALMRRVINANFRLGTAANAEALIAFAKSDLGSDAVRAEAISELADWAQPSGRDNVTGLWRPLPKRDAAVAAKALQPDLAGLLHRSSTPVTLATIKSATKLSIKSGAAAAYDLVADARRSSSVRVEALKALAALKGSRLTEALKLAQRDRDEALRAEATRIEAQLKPADATAKLQGVLQNGTLAEKQSAFATLSTVPGPTADEILLAWIDRLIARQVPTELQLDLLDASAQRESREIKDKLAEYERARPADDDLRAYRECLVGGNAAEGKKVFLERVEVSCVRCHTAGGDGGEVGPNLAGIGLRQPREYLLQSIVYPNKHIAPGFENVTITMKSGTVYAAVVKSETSTEIELNSPEDGLLKLNKADIQSRDRGLSAMPEELRQVLTKRDLRNLVEFLAGLK
jgi:quinoprotein glucose dehydrogenase